MEAASSRDTLSRQHLVSPEEPFGHCQLRARRAGAGPAWAIARPSRRPGAPFRLRFSIRQHSLHRAPRRGGYRALRRQRRRQLWQCSRWDDQRPLHDEADPPARTLAKLRGRRVCSLAWVDWFNNRRLLEPIGNIPPAEAEERYYAMLDEPAMAAW